MGTFNIENSCWHPDCHGHVMVVCACGASFGSFKTHHSNESFIAKFQEKIRASGWHCKFTKGVGEWFCPKC